MSGRRFRCLDRWVEIRPYCPEDEAGVLRLQRQVFGSAGAAARRDRAWRYRENPAGAHRTMVATLDGGDVIASVTGVPLRGCLAGRPATVAAIQDAMVHPSYRAAILGRRGLFVCTAGEWIRTFTTGPDPIAFAFGTPQTRHAKLGKLAIGYELWSEVRYLVREAEDTLVKRIRRRLPDPRIVEVRAFGDAADELWQRLAPAYPSAVVRDARYLRWRYDEAPEREYLRLALRAGNGRWAAWIVMRVQGETATIVDALLPPGPFRAASALLYRAIGMALQREADFIQAWSLPGSPLDALLGRSGFARRPWEGAHFAARLLDRSLDKARVRGEWYFQPGDADEH